MRAAALTVSVFLLSLSVSRTVDFRLGSPVAKVFPLAFPSYGRVMYYALDYPTARFFLNVCCGPGWFACAIKESVVYEVSIDGAME